jgi:ribonuclease HI
VRGAARAVVVTDSEYVRLGITRWLAGWRSRGWKTVKGDPVRNRDLWEALDAEIGPHVGWEYVAGHSGDPDNERCDRIAVAFAEGRPVDLADGTRVEEPLQRAAAPAGGTRPANRKNRKKSRGKALFYLSLVGGAVERHATWAECEARVKGVSNARFKKCTRIEEEADILREWGVDPAQR